MVDIKELKEKEKEQRSNFIIDAAEKQFFAKGYDTVSMDDIAAEVGLSKAALYRYFETKEALYFAIVLRGTRILAAMLREGMDNAPTNIEKVTAYRDVGDQFAKDYADYQKCCYFLMSGRFDPTSLMANKDIQQMGLMLGEMYTRFRNAIEAGIEDGSIRSDVEPEEIAILLTMISDGINNMRPDLLMILASRGIDKEKFSRTVKRLIMAMITNTGKNGSPEGFRRGD